MTYQTKKSEEKRQIFNGPIGTINAPIYGGKVIGVQNGDSYENCTFMPKTQEEESLEAMDTGFSSFSLRNYRDAFENFKKAKNLTPNNEKAQLFYCIAFLSWKSTSSINISEMDQINNILDNIVRGQESEFSSLALLVLGIIRYDYYKHKNYRYHGLPSEELFKYLENYYPTNEEKTKIAGISISKRVQTLFNL